MELIRSKSFITDLISHGSWGSHGLGRHASTMDLYIYDDRCGGRIEWDIPSLEETEQIGLEFVPTTEAPLGLALSDYDGVSCLPREAIELLREAGILVDPDYED